MFLESLSKSAAQPVEDVDRNLLKVRLITVIRRGLSVPVVSIGTLCTASRPVVLTEPEFVTTLQALNAEKERKAEASRKGLQLLKRCVAELKAERKANAWIAEQNRARNAWKELCEDVVLAS